MQLYGRTLLKLTAWDQLGEILLEQSLYSNTGRNEERNDYDDDWSMQVVQSPQDEYREQQRLLALVKYTLKCVDLRCILRHLPLTKVHYRFLVVNFSLSPQTPKVRL